MELLTIECPSCQKANQPIAVVDDIQEYRCRACGLVYYEPCGCAVDHPEQATLPAVDDDWQMTTPPAPDSGPGFRPHLGCS